MKSVSCWNRSWNNIDSPSQGGVNILRLQGIAAASGYAMGTAFVLREQKQVLEKRTLLQEQTEDEIRRLEASISAAIEGLRALIATTTERVGAHQAEIFETHMLLLEDEEFIGSAVDNIRTGHMNAEAALQEASDVIVSMFEGMEDEYLRERAADIRDVTKRVMRLLQGQESGGLSEIKEPMILFAHDLTPSDTAQLDRDMTVGIAADIGGKTSHSAIIARSLDIPSVVGLRDATEQVKTGDYVIIDGIEGAVYVNPPTEVVEIYERKRRQYEQKRLQLRSYIGKPSQTADSYEVELVANIGNPQDALTAKDSGAEGIGLYRTEFLYMGRDSFPTEEEQFHSYKVVAELFGAERPVVIRTLDIGGDKELSYLDFPKESNPFLGYRAIRMCLNEIHIFKVQLRAIVRASQFGNIKIMYPMISTLQELRQANGILAEVRAELDEKRIPYNRAIEVGMMIEVPAAAMVADQFAKEVDFFSIGTNDLVQYMMAADRMNEQVAYLTEPFNPGVLRLIKYVVQAAHSEGKWVGMCGEMAGNPVAVPLLLGMGIDEFSMSASSILSTRALLHKLNRVEMQELAGEALQLSSPEEIKQLIEAKLPFIQDWKDSF
jgi:phosphotransferase system enzyme I (PtsI)